MTTIGRIVTGQRGMSVMLAEISFGSWLLIRLLTPCGWIVLLGLLAAGVWMWFAIGGWRDRKISDRIEHGRCWKCNYNVCDIDSDRCPECGMPITRPWRR